MGMQRSDARLDILYGSVHRNYYRHTKGVATASATVCKGAVFLMRQLNSYFNFAHGGTCLLTAYNGRTYSSRIADQLISLGSKRYHLNTFESIF